ncbi:spike base protein, RCAP_Rcc01079 family [Maritalea sp.]|uniref:spike base protein, RCAP_Rcc01079 family n=1 Tax=Maritalea sp. TaxID=2003361 RepID=UPI003EF32A7F
MLDRFESLSTSTNDPASRAFSITPDDVSDIAEITRALFVGVGGDVSVEMANGDNAIFKNVPNGATLPIRVRKVRTDTSANSILGLS